MIAPFSARSIARATTLAAALMLSSTGARADGISFHDPQDGAFDVSDYLLNHKGFLPVPTVITEPAIGYGGGLGLLFFDESMAEAGAKAKETGIMEPPNITGVGAAGTENGTWGAGLMHFHTWDGDRIRYLGAIGKTNLNTEYYGLLNNARSYQLNGTFLMQQVLFRLGSTPWFIGPRYTYFSAEARFTGPIAQELPNPEHDMTIGKGGVVVDYDTRDNMFFPNKGTYGELEAQYARGGLGSDRDFDSYNLRVFTWLPLSKDFVLGLRGATKFTSGDVPFYAQPYIDQRGVQRGRYQDKNAVMAEAELRWNVDPRWSVLGFTGAGRAYGKWHSFSDAETPVAYGAGFRYLIARKLGLAVGIDAAHSKEQNAWYIEVGSAWR
ncbi:BamA/TamA family outer membrane protein [Silvimonas sp. JCM 19000]